MTNVLIEADKIVNGPRAEAYGDAKENWGNTAAIVNSTLGTNLTAGECVLFMVGVKLARLRQTPFHRDSVVDICGYMQVYENLRDAPE